MEIFSRKSIGEDRTVTTSRNYDRKGVGGCGGNELPKSMSDMWRWIEGMSVTGDLPGHALPASPCLLFTYTLLS